MSVSAPMKPLHLPEPLRAHRRRRAARFETRLRATGGAVGPGACRRPGALRRLRQRARPEAGWARAWAVATVCVVWMALVAWRHHGDRAPLADHLSAYAEVVASVRSACGDASCAFRIRFGARDRRLRLGGHAGRPPADLGDRMVRLGLTAVLYRAETAQVWLSGSEPGDLLLFEGPEASPAQRAMRRRRWAFLCRHDPGGPPLTALGGGWYRVSDGCL